MDFIKRYPIFTTFAALLVIAAIAQFAMVFIFMGGVGEAKQKFQNALNSRQSTTLLSPRPSQENLEIAQQNLSKLKRDYSEKRMEIAGEGIEVLRRGLPADPNELYFNLDRLVSDYLSEARQKVTVTNPNGEETQKDFIQINDDFTFGFGYYIQRGEGPQREYLEDVWIQRQVIDYLLRTLYDAEPASLLSVEREPLIPLDTGTGRSTREPELPADTFLVPQNISARVPGVIDTMAFRIKFTGYSEVLRLFLNTLSTNEYSLVVSSVEVKTAKDQQRQTTSDQNQQNAGGDALSQLFGGGGGATPEVTTQVKTQSVVVDNVSEFTVIVELVQIKPLGVDQAGEEGTPEEN